MTDANTKRPKDDPFAIANEVWGGFLGIRRPSDVPDAIADWQRLGPAGQSLAQAHLLLSAVAEVRLLRRDVGRMLALLAVSPERTAEQVGRELRKLLRRLEAEAKARREDDDQPDGEAGDEEGEEEGDDDQEASDEPPDEPDAPPSGEVADAAELEAP